MLSQLTVGDWITAGARQWPDAPCLIAADRSERTFAEVDRRAALLAQALRDRGVARGERIAILATDSADHMEVILACFKAGVVFCDLNYRLRTPELENIMNRARPRAVFLSPRYRDMLAEIRGSVPIDFTCEIGEGDELEAMITASTGRIGDHEATHGEEIASIAFTSGTTGTPKGVMQSEG